MNHNSPWRQSTWNPMSTTEKRQQQPAFAYPPGRFPEHHAKEILRTYGIDTPRFMWAETADYATQFANRIGFPVVAKVISPDIYCKSDRDGIETRIEDDGELREAFDRFSRAKNFTGILVEERLGRGVELNVGVAKIDFQNGPAVFLERARPFEESRGDRTFRLPVSGNWNVPRMLRELGLLTSLPSEERVQCVNVDELERLIDRVVELLKEPSAGMEAIILDPVRCVDDRCVVLDARIKFTPDQYAGTLNGKA